MWAPGDVPGIAIPGMDIPAGIGAEVLGFAGLRPAPGGWLRWLTGALEVGGFILGIPAIGAID